MLPGKFFKIFCCLPILFKLNKFFQEYQLSVKQIGSRSGPTFCRAWSGSELFAKLSADDTRRKRFKILTIEEITLSWSISAHCKENILLVTRLRPRKNLFRVARPYLVFTSDPSFFTWVKKQFSRFNINSPVLTFTLFNKKFNIKNLQVKHKNLCNYKETIVLFKKIQKKNK